MTLMKHYVAFNEGKFKTTFYYLDDCNNPKSVDLMNDCEIKPKFIKFMKCDELPSYELFIVTLKNKDVIGMVMILEELEKKLILTDHPDYREVSEGVIYGIKNSLINQLKNRNRR